MSDLVILNGAAWKWPHASRKAHVFVGEEARSLCNRWLFSGRAENAQGTNPQYPQDDDCVSCWRRAKALGLFRQEIGQ